MNFHDPVADSIYEQLSAAVRDGRADFVREDCERLRFSARREERMRSAVGYSVLALDAEARAELEPAARLFHYAGQSFRSVGMTAKAGWAYDRSFRVGETAVAALSAAGENGAAAALYRFDLRSIGRAIACFTDSGLFADATGARRIYHDAELAQARRDRAGTTIAALLCWKHCLGYSLCWGRGLGFVAAGIALSVVTGWLVFAVVGATGLLSVCQRRFF